MYEINKNNLFVSKNKKNTKSIDIRKGQNQFNLDYEFLMIQFIINRLNKKKKIMLIFNQTPILLYD